MTHIKDREWKFSTFRIFTLPFSSCIISQLNIWLTSLVVIVFLSMSKQMGHMSSLWRLRGEIEISVPSVMASWGVRWSSYKLNSKKESKQILVHVLTYYQVAVCKFLIEAKSLSRSLSNYCIYLFIHSFMHGKNIR